MSYVSEVLLDGFHYAYLPLCYAELCHERHGVVVGPVCCAVSGHGDSVYAFQVEAELVECPYADEQCERGVKSAAYAHDDILASDVLQPSCQSQHLYVEYLLARCLHVVRLRYERVGVIVAVQGEFPEHLVVCFVVEHEVEHLGFLHQLPLCSSECCVCPSLCAQPLHVYLCHDELWLEREALRVGELLSVLVYYGVACIDEVLG